jgi:ActR/RegA family two-component response regulator
MPEQPRVLFVDDEESIRVTLPPMLESYGFSVTSAGTVPEALRLISQKEFDVLIADLNVGSPGDGFTVVSAMRRTQPKAVNFILTGYPAIETALEAIRQQVDDYLIKPTEIEPLVTTIKSKLVDRKPSHGIHPKRLPEIIKGHQDWIAQHWLAEVKKDPELTGIELSDSERMDHILRVLHETLEFAKGTEITPNDAHGAALHGETRRKQGYTVPLVVREAKLLLRVLAECVQQNLLSIQVSNLIPDMARVWEIIETELEISVRAFLEGTKKGPHEVQTHVSQRPKQRQTKRKG